MSVFPGVTDTATTTFLTINAGTNNQRAWEFSVTEPMFLHQLNARMRRAGSNNSVVQFAVWAANEVGQPGERLGYTGNSTVSTGPGSAGQIVGGSLTSSKRDATTGVAGSAIALLPGLRYFFGVEVQQAGAEIGLISGSMVNYRRTVGGGNPTDPFGSFTNETATTPILWGTAELDLPITVTLTAPPATISTITPIISGTIAQADSTAPENDRLAQYQIEVREAITTGQTWFATFTATTAERAAGAFSQTYAGTALAGGGQYEVRSRASGDLGVWGDWSAWRAFAVGSVGGVDVSASTPTGKQVTGEVGPYTGRWTHGSGTAMTHVQVRILASGVVIRTSPLVAKATIANAVFSVSTAEAAVSTAANPLPPGSYTYQFQGTATGGDLSPWSDAVAFSVNAAPNQPSNLRPTSGVTLAARPQLLWDGSDPDLDDVFGGDVVSYVEITWPDTSVHTYGPVSDVDPISLSGYLDLTSTEAPTNGTYTWRVRLNDGDVYGPWSAPAIFTLITAPLITITAPTENATVTTSTPGIAFTMTDGTIASYRARFYRPGVISPFFDSGSIVVDPPATGQTFQPAPGWLENGQLYDVDIVAVTPISVSSTSAKRRFRVTYPTAPGLTAVDATLLANIRDWEPTSVVVVWGQSALPQNEFGGYVIWRRLNTEDVEDAVPIRLIPNAGQTTFIDHHPLPNVSLIYSVSQLRIVGGDTRASVPVEVQIDTVLTVPVLVSLERGATMRAPVAWLSDGLSMGFRRADTTVETWGSLGAPLWVRNPSNFGAESLPLKFTIRTDDYGTLSEHLAAWRAMVKSGDPFSLRTEFDRLFVRIVPSGNWASRGSVPGTYDISLTVEEVFYAEAADITA